MNPSDYLKVESVIGELGFSVKDSGQRQRFESGMVRDTTEGKTDFSLCFDGPMFERLAVHLTKGAQKYEARNWMKAAGAEELARFRSSACRHFYQWLRGDIDEDHAAATVFNINGALYVQEQMSKERQPIVTAEFSKHNDSDPNVVDLLMKPLDRDTEGRY